MSFSESDSDQQVEMRGLLICMAREPHTSLQVYFIFGISIKLFEPWSNGNFEVVVETLKFFSLLGKITLE